MITFKTFNNKKIKKSSMLCKEDMIVSFLEKKYKKRIRNTKGKYIKLSKNNRYNRLLSNMKKHQNLIISIIKDILYFYDETNLCDTIFVNGSFSRLTCTYGSDIDFNLIYDSKYKSNIFPIELKINYILAKVLKFRGCDRIHTMMVYTNRIDNQNVELSDDKYLVYKNNRIKYFCRSNYEELISDIYNTSRDYSVLTDYLDEKILKKDIFNDWLYNYKILSEKNSLFSSYLKNNFNEVKNKDSFTYDLSSNIDLLIEKYSNNEYDSVLVDEKISIAKLKKRYKYNIIDSINKTILILNYCDSVSYSNLYELIKSKRINGSLRDSIMNSLIMVNRLHITLDKLGYDLSSHSSVNIDVDEFSKTYFDIYKSDYSIDLDMMEKCIYSEIVKKLKEIKNSIKKVGQYSIFFSKIEEGIDSSINEIKKIIDKNSKVLIFPWAFPTEINSKKLKNDYFKVGEPRYNRYIYSLKKIGINEKNIYICDCYGDSKELLIKKIEESDVLLFPGGNPEMLFSKVLHQTELLYIIKKYNKTIIGESAGAVLQFKRYFVTKENNYYEYFAFYDGFGVLDDPFYLDVHTKKDKEYLKFLNKISKDHKKSVYAIYDDGCLIYDRANKEVIYSNNVDFLK